METGEGFAPRGVNWGPKEGWKWHKVQIEAVGSGDGGDGGVSCVSAHCSEDSGPVLLREKFPSNSSA